MTDTAQTAAGDATSGPQITRMVCKPKHRFKRKVYGPGDEITTTPTYIGMMEEQGVLVPAGKEAEFKAILKGSEGDHEKALAAVTAKE